ncbi:hypothetical protein [Desulfobacter postgatei]|uniref:Uncharacterized protein n=1 Tax=Desulfobacter postgatei 2ac9 TaxID=879212 RepID=I5B3C2_9BACT|nr:hypothetical protein [Desulfobacter postgatei]EIM63985.1 hypothetical protein DespoDRAFT_02092 [Desulfobacter postgatei 2ac9]
MHVNLSVAEETGIMVTAATKAIKKDVLGAVFTRTAWQSSLKF